MKELATIGNKAVKTDGLLNKEAIIGSFISSLDKKQSTINTYKTSIEQFFNYVAAAGRELNTLTKADIVAFKKHLSEDGNKHSALTISTYIAAVKQFYKWAESEKLYPNIAAGISLPRNREYYIKQHLTKEECIELLDLLKLPDGYKERKHEFTRRQQLQMRDYAMISLMLWTGLRTIEVSRLDVGDITYKSGVKILRVWGKGHDEKDDFVVLPPECEESINDYLQTRGSVNNNEPLFAGEGYDTVGQRLSPRRIQQICKECLRQIGLDSHAYSAHSLRHTTAVQILLNGGDMYDVFYALRHVDPAVSQKYVKSIEQERRLQHGAGEYLKHAFVTNED